MSAENRTRRVYTVETACAGAKPVPPSWGAKLKKKKFWGAKIRKKITKIGVKFLFF
jgi:hypothetical protein